MGKKYPLGRSGAEGVQGRRLLARDRLRGHEDHRVRLVEPAGRVAGPIGAVEVDAERTVPLVTEGRVVAQRSGGRVDVEHEAAVVAVVARPGDEVVAEHHAGRRTARREVEVVEGTP